MRFDAVECRYRTLFDDCYRPVLAYALRRSNSRAGAEDAVAETFLVAWRRIGEVPIDDGEARAWLIGTVRRVLSNARRGDVRRDRLIARLHQQRSDLVTRADDPVFDTVVDSSDSEVGYVLARLRAVDAEILQLALWEQLTHAQMAIVLDCSTNAVAIRLHRARNAFAAEYEKHNPISGHHRVGSTRDAKTTGDQ